MSSNKCKLKVLFIGKADNFYAKAAAEFIRVHFENPEIVFSKRQDPFPEQLYEWRGDLLISYLAQWIIPNRLLANADLAAINLHPGPPEYPGIGCTNFAVYNEEKDCIIIDPGCYFNAEKDELAAFITQSGLTPRMLLNTHCHLDHVFGNRFVAETYGLSLHLHAKEKPLREMGFGTVLTHVKDGIARGTGTVVTLGNEKENFVLVKDKAAAHYSFNKGSSTQTYPSSMMGNIALLRQ